MRLSTLVAGAPDLAVTGFAIDHRKVAPGTVFGAFRGSSVDGEDFIPAAIAGGAVAVVARPEAAVEGALHIADANPRERFATLAARFFAPFPATCVAVTGTNGKTSTVEMTRQLWRMAGHHAASIGTLGVATADERVVTGLTTPDVVTFLSNVAGLAREGVTHLAFEASSHGLSQYRTQGVPVTAAAFTNLGRDHLDYHGDMAAYFTAKLRLFSEVVASDGAVVVWADDPQGARVIDLARERGNRLLTVGTHGDALRLVSRTPTLLGQTLVIADETGAEHRVALPLIGAYQAANALVAAGLVIATGGPVVATLGNLARLQPVRGRLERAAIARSGAPVYVDYAHTPDAIDAAVAALKPHAAGRLILVFGAGGDRDEGKREPMGIAARAADVAIVTDDNPRGEDPAAIRAAVLKGAAGAREIGDRRAAIAAAVAMATADDIVLIAGKGHEQGQIVGDLTLPFDDVAVAREVAG